MGSDGTFGCGDGEGWCRQGGGAAAVSADPGEFGCGEGVGLPAVPRGGEEERREGCALVQRSRERVGRRERASTQVCLDAEADAVGIRLRWGRGLGFGWEPGRSRESATSTNQAADGFSPSRVIAVSVSAESGALVERVSELVNQVKWFAASQVNARLKLQNWYLG